MLPSCYDALVQAMAQILPYIQIILSILLVAGILIQQSDAGLGSAFGDDGQSSSTHSTRRGLEKLIFNSTIIIALLFTASAFASLLLAR